MATATINGITFSQLTVSECMEIARQFSAPSTVVEQHEQAVQTVVKKAKQNRAASNSGDSHTLACGHSVPKSRGRYPSQCDACQGVSEPVVESKPSKTRSDRNSDNWLTEPASEKQIARLTRKLGDSKVGKSVRARYEREIESGVTGGRAREMNANLNALLGIEPRS